MPQNNPSFVPAVYDGGAVTHKSTLVISTKVLAEREQSVNITRTTKVRPGGEVKHENVTTPCSLPGIMMYML